MTLSNLSRVLHKEKHSGGKIQPVSTHLSPSGLAQHLVSRPEAATEHTPLWTFPSYPSNNGPKTVPLDLYDWMGQDLTCSKGLTHKLRSDFISQKLNNTENTILASWQQSANSDQTAEQPKPVTQKDTLLFTCCLPSIFCLFNGSYLHRAAFCRVIRFLLF